VLLTSINSQLVGIGYTVAVEYLFYIYFSLALLCLISLFVCERARLAEKLKLAFHLEYWTRIVFLLIVVSTFITITVLFARS